MTREGTIGESERWISVIMGGCSCYRACVGGTHWAGRCSPPSAAPCSSGGSWATTACSIPSAASSRTSWPSTTIPTRSARPIASMRRPWSPSRRATLLRGPRRRPVTELEARLGADRIQRSVPLAPFTTFRIGGPADLYYESRTARELARPSARPGAGRPLLPARGGSEHPGGRWRLPRPGHPQPRTGIEFLDDRPGAGRQRCHGLPRPDPGLLRPGLGGLHHFVGSPAPWAAPSGRTSTSSARTGSGPCSSRRWSPSATCSPRRAPSAPSASST
jgi:hypothetical protein